MSSFTIVRNKMTETEPTLGLLSAGDLRLFTLELPWKGNQPGVSCFPVGTYTCLVTWSNRFQRLMPRLYVPGREGILIHSLNWVSQTEGCVGLGMRRAADGSLRDSRKAFNLFFEWIGLALKEGPASCVVSLAEPTLPLPPPSLSTAQGPP